MGRRRESFTRWTIFSLVMLFAGTQAALQFNFERTYPAVRFENLLYLPKGAHLKAFSLGFRNLVADGLWMKAIGYFGGHSFTDREYPWLAHILEQITELDPPFRHPYIFGGVVLAVEGGDPRGAIRFLEKGMRQYPGDFRFPFYLGFTYFYYLKDARRAANYIQIAATIPGHPEYLPRLAASLLTRSGRIDAAIRFLETAAAEAREEYVRKSLYEKMNELIAGRIPEGLEGFLSAEEK